MATTTPNYGWAVPTSTDLVKDGATAIETLGDAIDASLVDLRGGTTGQVLKKASATEMDFEWGTASSGLTLINTTSFSAVTTQSISDVFSSTYDAYKIIINAEGTGSPTIAMRLRVSGTDNSSAIYNRQRLFVNNTTVSANRDSTTTFYTLGALQNSQRNLTTLDVLNPFATLKTTWTHQSNLEFYEITQGAGFHDTATSYTGFTLLLTAGTNMTGTVSTYGYSK
jgi:hypothetical protein